MLLICDNTKLKMVFQDVRGELPLNVHAQEFQMNRANELQNSRFQFDYLGKYFRS